jgi:3',5'-cyclic AMP phosphodiesterase CpdA
MARVIHISDLHFGRTRSELLRPLIAQLNEIGADLIAISGDLTQRARSSQFRAARAFLDRLETPVLVVPGNHDVPLDDLFTRMFYPFRRYRKWIDRELEPHFENDEITVTSMNTVNPYAWQRGRVGGRALRRVCNAFDAESGTAGDRVRIVVAHHPFEHQPTDTKVLMKGAEKAVNALADCGADIILTGHLHSWRAEPFAERVGRRGALQVHAGTGLSTRLRGEENDFNVLTIRPGEVTVDRWAAGHGAEGFGHAQRAVFRSGPQGWSAVSGDTMPA